MTEFEIRKQVELTATPEQVWNAIATGPGLAAWFMPMEVDPDSGSVVAWEPGQRLAIQTPPGDDGSTHAFEYLIEGRDGGTTILRFVHSGVLGGDWGDEYEHMTSFGWDMYLHTLSQYLRYFADRPGTYVEAEAPTDQWPRLLDSIGLPAPAIGDVVRLDLPGIGLLEGVVDYTAATFLGFRTNDALIRFHGRALIGMPIAVSHHAYADVVDTDALTAAWTAWLSDAVAA